jgi:hypothetical protein
MWGTGNQNCSKMYQIEEAMSEYYLVRGAPPDSRKTIARGVDFLSPNMTTLINDENTVAD